MQYDISVIVPVYNAENYIEKCLDSIIHQTVNSLELICVNDGSCDDSLAILKKYEKLYFNDAKRKILIIDKENGGPSQARNIGLEHATGKYVAFVDSDDYIDDVMYENLICIAERENINVVLCNIINSFSDGRNVLSEPKVPLNVRIKRDEIIRWIFPALMKEDIFGGPCNRIYKRDFLIDNSIKMPEQLGYGEDAVFQMQVFDLLEVTWFDSNSYYHYIHREASQSCARPNRLEDTLIPLYKIRCFYGEKWDIDRQYINHYFLYCAIMDLVTTMRTVSWNNKWRYLKCFLQNDYLKEALYNSNITKDMYTIKIYWVYRIMKLFLI